MTGNLNLGGHEIINLAHVPTTDNSAVMKKWVTDEFPTKREVLDGFTLSGPLDMSGYEIYGLPDVPNTDNSAANKKYVNDRLSTASGLTQAQADGRYVRKTKIALGEWMDTFDNLNFVAYNWSRHVRKSVIGNDTNIEIKVASFVTDMSISQLNKHKLIIGIVYVGSSSMVKKHIVTVTLPDKTFSSFTVGNSGRMYSYHIHEDVYIGKDADVQGAILWQVGAKFQATKSHVLLSTKAYVSFATNEAGQYG